MWFLRRMLRTAWTDKVTNEVGYFKDMGGATGGGGDVEAECPPLLGPAGYRGYRGRSNENNLCFYSSLYSVLYK